MTSNFKLILIGLIFALTSCDGFLKFDDKKIDHRKLIGCYRFDNRLVFEMDLHEIRTGGYEFPITGYYRGKLFDYVELNQELLFDPSVQHLVVDRDIVTKHKIVYDNRSPAIELLSTDGKWRIFRREDCS